MVQKNVPRCSAASAASVVSRAVEVASFGNLSPFAGLPKGWTLCLPSPHSAPGTLLGTMTTHPGVQKNISCKI